MPTRPTLIAVSDIRDTPDYQETNSWLSQVWDPGFGSPFDPDQLDLDPDQRYLAFTAEVRLNLSEAPDTRIGLLDLADKSSRILSDGPNSDRFPVWSPDSASIAFLSDRETKGVFQAWLLKPSTGEVVRCGSIDGNAEYLQWSPNGSRILIGIAGVDADPSGEEGSKSGEPKDQDGWLPLADVGGTDSTGRHIWLVDPLSGEARLASPPGVCIWEAAWTTDSSIAVLFSKGTSESAWYHAEIGMLDTESGKLHRRYQPDHQLRLMRSSPDGQHLAFLSGIASDRGTVAGSLIVMDVSTGTTRTLEISGLDVTHSSWRGNEQLLLAGHRGPETLIGEAFLDGRSQHIWAGLSTAGRTYPSAIPIGSLGALMVVESWTEPPEIALAKKGRISSLTRFAHGGTKFLSQAGGEIRSVSWPARDGLEIQGWIAGPVVETPSALILEIHGGPIWAARNRWSARNVVLPLLVSKGYSVLMPNFRGSAGWGHEYMSKVYGDMGGEDVFDCLAGVDYMIEAGLADPDRLGLLGGSYGGFMSSLIVTKTDRFKAAVALSPVTDWFSQHGTSNIGEFDRLFLQDEPRKLDGLYVERSPVRGAEAVRTPLLTVVGGKDRCTPSGQGWQMHSSILENGQAPSALVVYPEEGHGVRGYPAVIDYCTRVCNWFDTHMPAQQ